MSPRWLSFLSLAATSSEAAAAAAVKGTAATVAVTTIRGGKQQQKREILRAQSIIDLNIHGTVSENCVRMPLINMASSSGSLAARSSMSSGALVARGVAGRDVQSINQAAFASPVCGWK